jgi:hypothetical protein
MTEFEQVGTAVLTFFGVAIALSVLAVVGLVVLNEYLKKREKR